MSELQPSWRDEVVVEPTEGWVSVSSPVREKESEEVPVYKIIAMEATSSGVSI